MRRSSTLSNACTAILSAIFLVAAQVPATSAASSTTRLPNDAADWRTFSTSEKAVAIAYEWQRFQELAAAGKVESRTISNTVSMTAPQAASLQLAASVSATATCQLTFDNISSGTWTRAGGWIDTSANVYYIYASRVALQGQLLRDGVLKGNWYQELYNANHAESWSGWDWKWYWEHPNYTSKGWFGAQVTSGGSWALGPDQVCSVSGTP